MSHEACMHRLSLLAGALLALLAAPAAQAQTAGFATNWPSSITVFVSSNQITYSNLPVTNVIQSTASFVTASTPTNITGFSFLANPGLTGAATNVSNNLILAFTPGVFTNPVTNTLSITVTNPPGGTSATTNLAIIVTPPPPAPPLEIRFYNSSTNLPSNVFILPSTKTNVPNPNFWWTNAGSSNNWTNHIQTTTNMTVTLADIGVTGTNQQGKCYYSVYTTNFNNAVWYLSYGGGALPAQTTNGGGWNGNVTTPGGLGTPSSADASGSWAFSQWNAFEITVSGSPEDVGDITYINEFSIPLALRVFTNSTTDSTAYYQHGGWTNFSSSRFNLVASNLLTKFPNAVGNWRSLDGLKAVLFGCPSSAANGTLACPVPPGGVTNNSQNSFPQFTDYFNAVRANSARTNVIKDVIAIGSWQFFYNFNLAVSASNSLQLTGSIVSSNTSSGVTNSYAGLNLMIGQDAGPLDNWASWMVYTAPTPANFASSNAVTVYSPSATNPALIGQDVLSLAGSWVQIATNTGTAPSTSTTNTVDFYNSDFAIKVIGRIMGDLAAGFAFGFINSDVTNPSYATNGTNAAYGDSPSGSWWGGNQYPAAGTNRLIFGQVQPALSTNGNTFYSEFAAMIQSNGTTLAYVHPIYDRMQVLGGSAVAAGTPQDQLQPSVAPNGTPPVVVVELEMFNGLLSAPQPPLPPAPGARPIYWSQTNAFTNPIVIVEQTNYTVLAVLQASNMSPPASWVVQGLPAGMTSSNVVAGNNVQAHITGAPAIGSGAAGQDGGRLYPLTMIMSNSYGLVVTNISSPLNPASFYIQVNTTNGQDPAPGLVAASPAALAPLSTTQGAPSAPGAYFVSGFGLSNSSLTVNPPAGFEVSTNAAAGYTALLNLAASNGTGANSSSLRLGATPVYVRLVGAPSGSFSGNLSNISASVSTAFVAVAGTVSGFSSGLSYSNWLTNYPSLADTNQSADPDGDSFNNATEYAFDGNPTVGSPALLTAGGAGSNGVFRFAGLQGVSTNYTVQTTTNLSAGPWTSAGVTVSNSADQSGLLLSNSYQRREFIVPATGSNSFYRVLFTNAP